MGNVIERAKEALEGATPGPWGAEILTASDPNGDEWETDAEVSSACGKHIHGRAIGYHDEEDFYIKANAHLIALAPDLARIAIAAEGLAEAVESYGTPAPRVATALAAYRAALAASE